VERRELLTDLDALGAFDSLPGEDLTAVAEKYPFRVSRHFLQSIRFPGDPLWLQVAPDIRELRDADGLEDPLAEEKLSPVPNLVHRYADRVLWLVSHQCAVHCRFCTRKRRWREPLPMTDEMLQAGYDYLQQHREIKDVLLSGGDPLLLRDARLESILRTLRKISHLEIIRIGTRIPGVFPQRVTHGLARMLARYHPLYVNIHFNHPREITPECRHACRLLADAGIPLASQTVLLKGVNDDAEVLADLFRKLLAMRVRPYYLLQMDLTRSTAHFRTPISTGLRIIAALKNRLSGLGIPQFVVDLPGGRGKVPLLPSHVEEIQAGQLIFKGYAGRRSVYPLLPGEEQELTGWLHDRVALRRPTDIHCSPEPPEDHSES